MIVSMFPSLVHCPLGIFTIAKRVSREDEYGLEIPANFHFYGPEKAIKLTQK